jgi:hypothetical protein
VTLQFPKQLLLSIALLTACAAVQTPVATAQRPIAGSSEASITIGSSSIEGPDGNIHLNLGASYAYHWSEHFALLAEYNEQALGVTSSPPATPTLASAANCLTLTSNCGSTTVNGRSLQRYGAAFRYSFKSRSRDRESTVTPYIITGVGAFRASTASSTFSIETEEECCTPPGATYTETLADTTYSTGTAFGAYEAIGGGVSLSLNPHWGIRAEGRLIRMMTTSSTNSSVSTTTILATGSSSGNTTVVGGLGGAVTSSPATNDDFSAAVSLFYQWGGTKAKP